MGVSLLRTAQSLLTGRTIDVNSLSAMDKMMIRILFKFVYGHAEAFITELRKKMMKLLLFSVIMSAQCGRRSVAPALGIWSAKLKVILPYIPHSCL